MIVQCRVCRKHGSRLQSDRFTVEIRECASGLDNDNRQGGNIQDVDIGFDHSINLPGREQVIVIKITVAPDAVRVRNDVAEPVPAVAHRQGFEIAGRDGGGVDTGDIAD